MRTYNVRDIKYILEHPAILPRLSRNKVENVTVDPAKDIFLMDDKKTGLAIIGSRGDFHFQILPEFRENAHKFHSQVIEWIKQNTDFIKLTAEVPFLYKDVVNFGLKNGWDVEGINRKSYLKNGKLYDQYYLGFMLWDT